MPDTDSLLLFAAAALVILITPGPAVLFVVARSVQLGKRAGVISTLGLSCGALIHVAAAVLGLSAILASSAAAFGAVKLVGAGYLIYLGIRALRSRGRMVEIENDAPASRRHFLDGFVVNLFNPKIAIFFLAFLPQFVDPAAGPVRFQLAVLGLGYVALALCTDGAYALAAASSRKWLLRNRRVLHYEPYVSAAVYFALGLSAAFAGRRDD